MNFSRNNAELLESQEESDIENIIKIIEEARAAYKACKSRVYKI